MRTVAAIPALGLLVGSAAGLIFADAVQPLAYILLAASACVSSWAWWTLRRRAAAVAVAATFAAGGALLAVDAWERAWRPTLRLAFEDLARAERARATTDHRVLPVDAEVPAVVQGVLRADASPGASGVSLSVDVQTIDSGAGVDAADRPMSVSGGIVVSVVGSLAATRVDDWRAGRLVRMPVRLRRPSRYLDPGVPDNERALARRGTTLVGSVKSGALVEIVARGRWWEEAAGGVRLSSRRAITRTVGRWDRQAAAIVTAIVIGDRAGLDGDVQRRLQEAGTYHVIAISGGNIAILAGLLIGAFRLAGFLGRGAMLSTIGLLVAYGYLVGGGASVDRATLMASVYCAGRAFDQRSPPLNTLWLVATTLVAVDPLSVTDPAFVLTFGATVGILVVASTVATSKPRTGSALLTAAAGMGIASLAAEGALFPVGALVFSRVTFAGLGLNFLAIPLMAVAQVAGMAVVPLALLSSRLASVAGFIAYVGAAGLVWSANLLRFAPGLTYRVAPPSWAVVCIYYVSLCTWWMLRRRRAKVAGSEESPGTARVRRISCVMAGVAAVWILAQPWTLWASRGDGRLHVTFLDVGQGDSLLVRFPYGSTMLVDAGGLTSSFGFDVGDRVVAPVLRDAGIRRLDYVVLSHGDPDHIGGAPAVVREFRPREVWEGIPVPRFEPLTALRLQTQALGSRWANVYRDDHVVVDGVEVIARHPDPADWERQRVRNDDSLVLDVRWRDLSLLLTGDIGNAVERALVKDIPSSSMRVLKVPHHGSLTSSSVELLQAFRPQVAVFSAGRDNHFGHPAPDVLRRYRDEGTAIFRTDEDGAVTLDTDGRSISIRTFTGRRGVMSGSAPYHEDTTAAVP